MRQKIIYAMPIAAMMFAATPAMAGERAQGGFRVSAQVPVSCKIEPGVFSAQDDNEVVTGTLFEACNTNRGFSVIATHRELAVGERVRVRYGRDTSDLNPGGFSLVAMRAGARFGPVPVTIQTGDIAQPISISFALTAV